MEANEEIYGAVPENIESIKEELGTIVTSIVSSPEDRPYLVFESDVPESLGKMEGSYDEILINDTHLSFLGYGQGLTDYKRRWVNVKEIKTGFWFFQIPLGQIKNVAIEKSRVRRSFQPRVSTLMIIALLLTGGLNFLIKDVSSLISGTIEAMLGVLLVVLAVSVSYLSFHPNKKHDESHLLIGFEDDFTGDEGLLSIHYSDPYEFYKALWKIVRKRQK